MIRARNVSFEELRAAYYEQVQALVEGGADVLLVETIFDTLNAKAALFAIDEYFEASGERLPILISGTVTDASGRILSRPDRHGLLAQRAPRTAAGRRPELRAGCRADATPYIQELARRRPTPSSAAIPTPACPTR